MIDGDAQAGRGAVLAHAQAVQGFVFQQGGLLGQAYQDTAVVRGLRRDGAQDQQPSHAGFQGLDALGHGRGRDVQGGGGPLEAAFAHHGRQGAQIVVIQLHGRAFRCPTARSGAGLHQLIKFF